MFNHHKIKKKWGRGFARASQLVNDNRPGYRSLMRDSAWHHTKRNPFWSAEALSDKRKKIELILAIVLFLITFGLILCHPFFRITKIQIENNTANLISEKELSDKVAGIIAGSKFLFLSRNNYYLLNIDEIRDIVSTKYSFNTIYLKKIFPQTLYIKIEEKQPELIYDNGSEYAYADNSGVIIKIISKVSENLTVKPAVQPPASTITVNTSSLTINSTTNTVNVAVTPNVVIKHIPEVDILTKRFGVYPVIYDNRHQNIGVNSKVLNQKTINGVIEWLKALKLETDLKVDFVELRDELGTITLKIEGGWDLKVRLDDIDIQIDTIKNLLKNNINQNNLNYIDLRFPGYIYWK